MSCSKALTIVSVRETSDCKTHTITYVLRLAFDSPPHYYMPKPKTLNSKSQSFPERSRASQSFPERTRMVAVVVVAVVVCV